MSFANCLTFILRASVLDRRRLAPRRPDVPGVRNSGPRLVSAVNECLVPRFDSNIKPGRSSRKIVACCWPSELYMWSSDSLRDVKDQFPTTRRNDDGFVSIGWLVVFDFTADRALCSFSRNSPRFSATIHKKCLFFYFFKNSYLFSISNTYD